VAQTTTAPTTATTVSGAGPMAPAVIFALCVVAAVGTVMLLPSRREAPLRKIGGIILLAAGALFGSLLVRWTAGHPRGGMGAYFWIFASIAIIGALRVVTHGKPVYSALYFVLTVFASAGLFLLVQAEFMAAALIIIYAGAILVTYVFVIMLAAEATAGGQSTSPARSNGSSLAGLSDYDSVARSPVLASALGFLLLTLILTVVFDRYQAVVPAGSTQADQSIVIGATQRLGEFLFKTQLVNLELGGLILTIAMVGAIMIARKRVIVFDDEDEFAEPVREMKPEMVSTPSTPVDDNPHSLPVDGTRNPRQKAYPEN
jgi:NADH-quinone oxidoreductase subunit J